MILIQAEVKVREFDRGLLLAAEAALRGQVALVGPRAPWLDAAWQEKSILHLNGPPDPGLMDTLDTEVSSVTMQDEESPITLPDDELEQAVANRLRLSPALRKVDRYFTWGPREERSTHGALRAAGVRSVPSGGFRADFWRPDFAPFYCGQHADLPSGPYVLIASMFGASLNPQPVWQRIPQYRSWWPTIPDAAYFSGLGLLGEEWRAISIAVPAVLRAVDEFPEVTFVVRPHPAEAWAAWSGLLPPRRNLLVRRDGSIGHWIRGAAAVVHFGETVGFEAIASGLPTIALCPGGFGEGHPSSLASAVVRTEERGFIESLAAVLRSKQALSSPPDALAGHFWNLQAGARTACSAAAEEWAELLDGAASGRQAVRLARTAARAESVRLRRKARRRGKKLARTRATTSERPSDDRGSESPAPVDSAPPEAKFPAVAEAEVVAAREGLANLTERYAEVSIERVGTTLVLVGQRGLLGRR